MSAARKREEIDEALAEEAAGWVARVHSDDASNADRQAFREWLASNPRHKAAYDEMSALWGDLKDVPISEDRLKRIEGARRRRRAAGLGAVALVAGLGFSLDQTGLIDRWQADHYTRVGEVRTITLPDGSEASLNTDTAIDVIYTEDRRIVEILRGEVFVDVVSLPDRPFSLRDPDLVATARGTRYSLKSATGGLGADVRVQEGVVEVKSRRDGALLEGGDIAVLQDDDRLAVSRSDVAGDTAWTKGRLVFSDRPLQEVLATLGRYRSSRIVVIGEETAALRVSGVFDLGDTDEALGVLEKSLPVQVNRLAGMLVIVRPE